MLGMLLLVAGAALAQEEPTVNESDYDTAPPSGDEAYLDETPQETADEPTLSDGDLDTSIPTNDEAYLDEAPAEGPASSQTPDAKGAPGVGLAALLGALGAAALVARR